MNAAVPNYYFTKDDDYVRRIVSAMDDVALVSNLDLIDMLFDEDGFEAFALTDEIMALREFVHEEMAHRYSERVARDIKETPDEVYVNGEKVRG